MDGQRGAATGNKFVKHDGRRSTITAFNTTLNTIQRERIYPVTTVTKFLGQYTMTVLQGMKIYMITEFV